MKLVSYLSNGRDALGMLVNGEVYPINYLHPGWPARMADLLSGLQEGDRVELSIEGLGLLSNTIVRDPDDHSIFALKKKHDTILI